MSDLIDRQALIEYYCKRDCGMTREECTIGDYCHEIGLIEEFTSAHGTNLVEVGKNCISRQAAIDIYDDYNIAVENGEIEAYGRFRKQLAQLPPIQPRRGRWIPVTNGRSGHECNQCHEYAPSYQTGEEHLSDFYPSCGADMRGVTT